MIKRRVYLILILSLIIFIVFTIIYSSQIKNNLDNSVEIKNTVDQQPIGMLYSDASVFLSALPNAKTEFATGTVTGIIVPHHLLAKDLAAEVFSFVSRANYRVIVLLSPDHYSAGKTKVSVTERNFSTIFGELGSAREIVQKLKELPFVSEGNFFYREHGLQAELPFIKYYFPNTPVVALTFKPGISQLELNQMVEILKTELPVNSLIIQSTDFSHYLSPNQAAEKDQETLKILNQADYKKILELNQPANIDSLAASYVQASLQKELFQTSLKVINHKNSQDYTNEKISSSTSYITAAYIKDENTLGELKTKEEAKQGQADIIFVGDIMLSRYIGEMMNKKKDYDFPYVEIRPFLLQADSVFANLESPVSIGGTSTGSLYPFKADPLVVDGLKNSGFTILSVANNHAFDYGREAFLETLKNIKNAGLSYVGGGLDFVEAHDGAYQEINGVKIIYLAYTDLLPKTDAATENTSGIAYLEKEQMVKDIKKAKEKADLVIVSYHWGREYETTHNLRQEEIAKAAIEAGASLIIGHHPHVVQELEVYRNVTVAYSLGNFIFDQNFSPETSKGLALKVIIDNKKISSVNSQIILFNHNFQPYISK